MNYKYKRKIFISIIFILLILLVFRTFTLTCNDFQRFVIEDTKPVLSMNNNGFSDLLLVLPRAQYKLNYSAVSNVNSTFSIFKTWESVFVLMFTCHIIAIDRRKQIIKLILQHYEGGKYKHSLSILPS